MYPVRLNRVALISDALSFPPGKLLAVHEGILAWYRRGHRDLPWRRTSDPYAILISEIMLQQTQVDRVVSKYHEFLERYPTLAALAAAPRAEVIRSWSPLGYNLRAVRLHEIARQAVERYDGRLPDTVEGLLSLKGIGRYTAGAIACFAFGRAVAALDTNVRRVVGRIFATEVPGAGDDDRLAWPLAEAVLPLESAYDWNQALMDLGATICVSRTPRCLLCPVHAVCSARIAGLLPTQASPVPNMAPLPLVAERREAYVADGEATAVLPATPSASPPARGGKRSPVPAVERFEGSRRWYRGRIVDALRALPPGVVLSLEDLGLQIKPDFSPDDRAWLLDLAAALARDGLVEVAERDGGVVLTLPS
ncbi:MAG: A/G-specific adenine glycosylase [Chloroflexota bacterium]|nr:A/G-specific adenine glycosylase [Chloroflexota bacterium]